MSKQLHNSGGVNFPQSHDNVLVRKALTSFKYRIAKNFDRGGGILTDTDSSNV